MHRLRDGGERAVQVAVPIARERELVGDARQAIVEFEAAVVGIGGPVEALELIQDVAELVERPRGRRVEGRGGPEVARRLLEVARVAAPLVGFAAPQVGEHRVGAERDGAAVGLDRAEGLLVAQRGVAPGEKRAVVALARRRLVGERGAHRGQHEQDHDEQRAFHGGSILTPMSARSNQAGQGRHGAGEPSGVFRV